VLGRVWLEPWRLAMGCPSVGVGSGGDLSEEPVFQDVEPVTLDYRSRS
jgi:hypothetical protein